MKHKVDVGSMNDNSLIPYEYPVHTSLKLCIEGMKTPKRICIYPKDIQRITGRSERYGRNLLHEIRSKLNKAPHQYITIEEFAAYVGLEISVVNSFIQD